MGVEIGGPTADALLAAVGKLVEQSLTPLSDRGVVKLLPGVSRR